MASDIRNNSVGNLATGYPNPFADMASLAVPVQFRIILKWCEEVFSRFGTYRAAIERTIAYFITDIDVGGADQETQDKWRDLCNNVLGIKNTLSSLLREKECYGNSFVTVLVPFRRFLSCPTQGCGAESPFRVVAENKEFNFKYVGGEPEKAFVATCPRCHKTGPQRVIDRDNAREKTIRFKLWSPHQIEILEDPYSGEKSYFWRIPEDYKRLIREGHLFHLERAPKGVLRSIARNHLYKFNQDAIYHMSEPSLSGITARGWGLPRILYHMGQIWNLQVFRRQNEAIGLDYVTPFRVITPAPAQTHTGIGQMMTEPSQMVNGGVFRREVRRMIETRRRDPASMSVLGFPINFQMFGADANKLAPKDLIDQAMETLLNDAGVPIEMYRGSLQFQAAPVALRLYESTHQHIVHECNAFLAWAVSQIAQILSWEVVEAKMMRTTIADSLEKSMLAAQLMMSQHLSASTVLRELGYSWPKEQRALADEAIYKSELETRVREEMDQSAFAQSLAKGQEAAAPPGGAPPGGQPASGGDPAQQAQMGAMQGPVTAYLSAAGQNVPQTPDELLAAADDLAQRLFQSPEGIKDSELRRLKSYNEVLHKLVKERLGELRQGIRQTAGNQAVAAAQQGGMPA